jgi:diguanylate cyclase (GGDEF)-like protein/PAS domain S-box-containing protein
MDFGDAEIVKRELRSHRKSFLSLLVQAPTAFGVLLLSLVLTVFAWHYTTKAVERNAKINFERQVSEAKNSLDFHIQTYINILRASQGMFAATTSVERNEWRAFVKSLKLQNLYPGINGMGFIRYVPNSRKADYEQQVRQDTSVDKNGYPDFAIKPAGSRTAYFVIEYIEPFQPNRPALGLDVGHEPVRRAAVERARDTGEPAATGQIVLVQDATKQPGLLILLPVYRHGMPYSTVEQRRSALLGFIYAPFRASDLIQEALYDANKQDLDLEVYNGKDLMYDSNRMQQVNNPKFHPLLRQVTTLDVAGEPWQLYFTSHSSLIASADKTPILVLSGGTLISLLLFGIAWALASSRRRALLLATSMTAELRESENQLRDFFDNANDLIQSVSPDGKFVFVNRAWRETLGYSEEEINALSLVDILHPDSREHYMEALKSVQAGETRSRVEATFVTKNSRAITVEGSVNCSFEDGLPKVCRGIFRDITDRKRAEEELRRAHDELELRVQRRTEDLATANVALQAEITERSSAESALQQANEKLAGWVNELEQRNREIALLGKMSDVLQACLTVEEAYSAIATLVQPLFPQTSGGIFLISGSKKLVEAAATWGSAPLPSLDVFTPDECWALRRGRVHGVEETHSGLLCKHLHQELLPTESLCVPMMAQGEAMGVLYLGTQESGRLTETKQQLAVTVTEHIALSLANLKLRETLKNQSIRDPLTCLFNRRYMEESLERELIRCQRKQQPLSIIMLDVDHFKRFNDTFGHEAGDAVLQKLGQFLQSHIRGSDIACRYGGEELTLILPEASLEVTKKRAEQIREGIKHLSVQHHGQALGAITLSLGVASFPEHGLSGEAVIRAADAALYRAKKEGRDAVRVAP